MDVGEDAPIAGPSRVRRLTPDARAEFTQTRLRHCSRVIFRSLTDVRPAEERPGPATRTRASSQDDADAEASSSRRRRTLGARRVSMLNAPTIATAGPESSLDVRPSPRRRTASSASVASVRTVRSRPRATSIASVVSGPFAAGPAQRRLLESVLVLSTGETILHVSDVHAPSLDPSFDLEDVAFGEAGRSESVGLELWTRVPGETAWTLLLRAELHLSSLYGIGDDLVRASPSLGSDAIVIGLRSGEYIAAPARTAASSDPPTSLGVHGHAEDDGEADDPGALSDPGPSSSSAASAHATLLRKRRREEQLALDRDRVRQARERSLRETRMRASESLETVKRLVAAELERSQARVETDALKDRLGGMMVEGDGLAHLTRELSSCLFLAERARSDLADHQGRVEAFESALRERRDQLGARRDRLRRAQELLAERRRASVSLGHAASADEAAVEVLDRDLACQRGALVTTLDLILPIRPGSMSLSFTILEMKPPDASALGYIALLVDLLATYHQVPLQYAVSFRGSRSLVQDRNAKWYPLFEDGVEKYRAEYARFCLSKDVEQLCRVKGLEVPDIRDLLPNLVNCVLAMSVAAPPVVSNGHASPAMTVDTDSDDGALPSLATDDSLSDSPPRPRSPARSISSVRTVTPAAEKLRALQA